MNNVIDYPYILNNVIDYPYILNNVIDYPYIFDWLPIHFTGLARKYQKHKNCSIYAT